MKAFTLIEVIIAVTLAFVISSVAFTVMSDAKRLLSLSENRETFYYKASVGAIEKEAKNVYEMLNSFNIRNDEIIRDLKKDRLKKETSIEYSMTYKVDENEIKVMLKKINVYDKHNILNVYLPDIK